jgi:hypothetical protein
MPHLVLRILFILIAWSVFKNVSFQQGLDTQSFFVSYFLFIVPLIIDYMGFEPYSKKGKFFKYVGLIVCLPFFIFSMLGLTGSMDITIDNQSNIIVNFFGFESYDRPIGYAVYPLLIFIPFSIADWAIYAFDGAYFNAQKKMRKSLRNLNELQIKDEAEIKPRQREEEYVKMRRKEIKKTNKELEG